MGTSKAEGLDRKPSSVVYQLCDLGQVANLSEMPFSYFQNEIVSFGRYIVTDC